MQFPPLFINDRSGSYRIWESIALGLFQQFKFNYENLGTNLKPEKDGDIMPYAVWDRLDMPFYFGETKRVHFNRYYAYGGGVTGYPMANNTIASHHFTLETYSFHWPFPAMSFLNKEEAFPYIFSTEENFFMEGCNGTFLHDDKYLLPQDYPVYHPSHQAFFEEEAFLRRGLDPRLLIRDFSLVSYGIKMDDKIVRILHFALRMFWMSVLFLGVMEMLFGQKRSDEEKIEYLKFFWSPNDGKNSLEIGSYRLNVLSFLYLSFHPVATLLCYGLYRDKYGINQGERTTIYVKYGGKDYAFKDLLRETIREYIDLINGNVGSFKNQSNCSDLVSSALSLAAMYGVGYKTISKKNENIHIDSPVDFKPKDLAPELSKVDFWVSHAPQSPLWRIFYEFGGDWWTREEILQVMSAEGEAWERLRKTPRSFFVNYCHVYAAKFWAEQSTVMSVSEDIQKQVNNKAIMVLSKNKCLDLP